MSNIGKNIKKIRNVRKISQAEFAGLFDLARPSVGAYEEGRSEPKIDTIIQIAAHFNISIDVLLTKDLSVADLLSFGSLNKKLSATHQRLNPKSEKQPKVSGIPYVKVKEYLDYTINHGSPAFIDQLSKIDIPMSFKGEVRAFEMQGGEMEYHQQGLHHGDILFCQKSDKQELDQDDVFVLVLKDRLLIRRLESVHGNELTMISDDPNYERMIIDIDEIMEAWEVKSTFTTYLNAPKLLDEKILGMEKRLGILERLVKRMI